MTGLQGSRPHALRHVALVLAGLWVMGCRAPLGGWDVGKLRAEEPGIAAIEGQRLGDMTPYPMPDGNEMKLMTCRWSTAEATRVRLRLGEEKSDWARRAIQSLAAGTPGLRLEILETETETEGGDDEVAPGDGLIEVIEVGGARDQGPAGVGDTIVTCDAMAARAPDDGRTAGRLIRADIQMRSQVWNALDEPVAVSAADWSGAFMHELGHALGFQGHVRSGESILVLDQDRLRRVGRAVLAGHPWRDQSLEALYRLDPGRRLGRRTLSTQSQRWLQAIQARSGPGGRGPVARIGDRHGELEWVAADGTPLKLHFPFWSRQMRNGEALIGVPSRATRSHLIRPEVAANP